MGEGSCIGEFACADVDADFFPAAIGSGASGERARALAAVRARSARARALERAPVSDMPGPIGRGRCVGPPDTDDGQGGLRAVARTCGLRRDDVAHRRWAERAARVGCGWVADRAAISQATLQGARPEIIEI